MLFYSAFITAVGSTKSNSNEIYVICMEFLGCNNLDQLLNYHPKYQNDLMTKTINCSIMKRIKKTSKIIEMIRFLAINQYIFGINNILYVNDNPVIFQYVLNLVEYYKKYYFAYLQYQF